MREVASSNLVVPTNVKEAFEASFFLLTGSCGMKQTIEGFDHDGDLHWRAKLACGHYQHVRHEPPLRTREWILTESGRESRIGFDLECKKCDEKLARDFVA